MDEELFSGIDEIEYQQNKQVYRNCRKLFRDAYKPARHYRDNDTLTRSQVNDLAEAIRLGMQTLEYLHTLRENGCFVRTAAHQERLYRERAVLRKRVDELREIIYDPDKKLVPDNDGGAQ